jgi:hypothetical protein
MQEDSHIINRRQTSGLLLQSFPLSVGDHDNSLMDDESEVMPAEQSSQDMQ